MNKKEIYLHAKDITNGTLRELIDDSRALNDEEIGLLNNIFCGYYRYGFNITSNNGDITIEDVLLLMSIAYIAGREANDPESEYAGWFNNPPGSKS